MSYARGYQATPPTRSHLSRYTCEDKSRKGSTFRQGHRLPLATSVLALDLRLTTYQPLLLSSLTAQNRNHPSARLDTTSQVIDPIAILLLYNPIYNVQLESQINRLLREQASVRDTVRRFAGVY